MSKSTLKVVENDLGRLPQNTGIYVCSMGDSSYMLPVFINNLCLVNIYGKNILRLLMVQNTEFMLVS